MNHRSKKNQRLSALLLLAVMPYTMASSSGGSSKTYCLPTDLTKYKPTPTNVASPNVNVLEDKLTSGIIEGNSVDTETVALNDSPFNIFTLSIEAAARVAKQEVMRTKTIMDTGTLIGVSLIPRPIIYNNTDVMNTIFQGLLPINAPVSDSVNISFPGAGDTTDNNNNAITDSQSTSTTSTLVGQLPYATIIKNYLGGKSPTTAQFTGTSPIAQLLVENHNLLLLLKGCNATFPSGSSSSSTSSTSNSDISNTTNTVNTTNSNHSGSQKSPIPNSLQSCSAAIAACEMNYTKKNFASLASAYMNGFSNNVPTSDLKTFSNDTNTILNNITNEDLSDYSTTVGMNFPSDCLQATCTGSNCPADSDVQAELQIFINYLEDLQPKLATMQALYVNQLLEEAQQEKLDNPGNYQDDQYFYNPGYTLGGLLRLDSFGLPSDSSPMHCSTKNAYQQAAMTAIANNEIDKLSSTIETPAYLQSSDMPIGINDIIAGGSIGSALNQNNTINYATAIPDILKARSQASQDLKALALMYNTALKSFSAQKSLALQNLRMLVTKRSQLVTVPTFYNPMQLKNQCANGINNATTSDDCSFQTPFTNINTGWNITDGQQCSLAELERIEAEWRQQPFTNDSGAQILSPWMQQIQYMTGTEIARAQNFLLAEIREQIYNNNQLRERINTTKSVSYIVELSEKKKAMYQMLKNIASSEQTYINGGTG